MAETTMIRGIMGMVSNYLICYLGRFDITFSNVQSFKYLVTRSILLAMTSLFVGASQFILPLSIVHTIISSSTLFIFVIDYLINGVRINVKQGVGIAIGLIGVVLACNGRLITTLINPDYKYETKYQNYITDNIYLISLFTICMVVMMAGWAYAIVITKSLHYNMFQVNYLFGIVGVFVGGTLSQFLTHGEQK